MLSSFIWIYIIPIIFISPFLTISMNSWFSIWLTLELNLMAFVPLIIFFNKFYKELSMKYFIIQSFSSSMLIMASNFFMINTNNINCPMILNYFINLSLLIKMGAAPYHFWFINLMNNLNWSNCLILSTWQKIIPMILITQNYFLPSLYFSIILSCIIGSLFGINHQSIRLIMGYSSLNHISWMLTILLINENSWIFYFINYFSINLAIMMMFHNLNIYFINQLFLINFNLYKIFLLFNFLSLSSLPPMMGFLMKWHSMYIITKSINIFILLIMIFMSLFTFFYYIRLMISMSMLFKMENKLNIMNKFSPHPKINLFILSWMTMFINLWIMNNWIL